MENTKKSTSKYFPAPTEETNATHSFIPTDDSSAGLWKLNFLEGGIFAPSCNGYSLNRYDKVLHGWTLGTANVNQFKIYERVAIFDDSKVYQLNGETTAQWMFVHAAGVYSYLYNTSEKKIACTSMLMPIRERLTKRNCYCSIRCFKGQRLSLRQV